MEPKKKRIGRPSLETLPGIRQAMARLIRAMRDGKRDVLIGESLVRSMSRLAALLQDERDTRYQQRIKVLWEAHQRGEGAAPEALPPPEVQ